MASTLAYLLAPLLVFGMYHLLTWFNVFRINEWPTWKRVAVASAISHTLLATGFFVFCFVQFQGMREDNFGRFFFNQSEFWRLMMVFDTLPMLAILGLFAVFDRAGVNPPGLLVMTFTLVYIIGTAQWFLVGAGVGALLERLWSGLKTPEEEDEEWL